MGTKKKDETNQIGGIANEINKQQLKENKQIIKISDIKIELPTLNISDCIQNPL